MRKNSHSVPFVCVFNIGGKKKVKNFSRRKNNISIEIEERRTNWPVEEEKKTNIKKEIVNESHRFE